MGYLPNTHTQPANEPSYDPESKLIDDSILNSMLEIVINRLAPRSKTTPDAHLQDGLQFGSLKIYPVNSDIVHGYNPCVVAIISESKEPNAINANSLTEVQRSSIESNIDRVANISTDIFERHSNINILVNDDTRLPICGDMNVTIDEERFIRVKFLTTMSYSSTYLVNHMSDDMYIMEHLLSEAVRSAYENRSMTTDVANVIARVMERQHLNRSSEPAPPLEPINGLRVLYIGSLDIPARDHNEGS